VNQVAIDLASTMILHIDTPSFLNTTLIPRPTSFLLFGLYWQ